MGKFIDTTYKDTVNGLVSFHKDLLNQDFYILSDKKGTKVTYYNMNLEASSLDPGAKIHYADIGDDSPLRFNVIHDMFIYQINKFELNFENGEFGMESNEITGESYILPNTIHPYEGDYFTIDHASGKWLMKVRECDRDTLSNGANVWKIGWVLDRTTNEELLKNVVEEYQYIDVQEGTNIKAVVESTKYEQAYRLEEINETLRSFFIDLFYSDKVQTFIYQWYNFSNMYDPFAIEFIIRNRLLNSAENYKHVRHQAITPRTFGVEYNKSFWYALEQGDMNLLKRSSFRAQANAIDDLTSIFSTRYDTYFMLDYHTINEPNGPFNPRGIIPIIEEDWIDRILEDRKIPDDNDIFYKNIFVKYFNNADLVEKDVEAISHIDFQPTERMFYDTLVLIFCLDYYIEKLLS